MNRTHQIALAAARAAMNECLLRFGGEADCHIQDTVATYFFEADVPVMSIANDASDGLTFNTQAILEDGATVTVDLRGQTVGIVEV